MIFATRTARPSLTLAFVVLLALPTCSLAAERVLDATLHHVRLGDKREWTDFPEVAEASPLGVKFDAVANAREATVRIRHRDLKQTWKLFVNDRELGRLPQDENAMVTFWPVPPGTLVAGANTLRIVGSGKDADDIIVGDVRLDDRSREEVLTEATVEVAVTDADAKQAIPCRITVLDEQGSLMTVGAKSDGHLAVRPGVIYTSDGQARFGLPAGKYTLYSGRGFEYGIDRAEISVKPGDKIARQLAIRREVPTPGYVSCDTHCHTLTFSGHGDSSIEERMVTIAAEEIELPIATDHNVAIDYEKFAGAAGVRRYFTPVVGSEVTTPKLGHFNVFPIRDSKPAIDHKGADWPAVFDNIFAAPGVEVAILNHARDLHGGFRPFGPQQHIGLVGENLDGWKLRANAMEVINSGALQTDGLQLFRDWFGLLNRGLKVTPVGSSDSHDVARHFIGQGRTYIRCPDADPGKIDVREAVKSFVAGRVMVSLGLLTEITVDGRYGPGDVVPATDDLDVSIRVFGPSWTRASQIMLYANGVEVRKEQIGDAAASSLPLGVKWQGRWKVPRPKHDVHLVAIATGPGVTELYWPIPKAYQPTSPEWRPYVIGATGAVWIDADGSGDFTSAFAYATRLVDAAHGDLPALMKSLAAYDEAVAAQAASILRSRGISPLSDDLSAALKSAAPATRRGFDAYLAAWKETQLARQP